MNKFWVIVFHTYLNKLKTKSFIITTIITALILVALTNMEKIIDVLIQTIMAQMWVSSMKWKAYIRCSNKM